MPKTLSAEEIDRRLNWKKNCLACGKVFGWSKSGDKAVCCSRECAGKFNGSIASEKTKLATCICSHCGVEFKTYHKNRKYCSKTCSGFGRTGMKMKMGFKCRVDANQSEIVKALKDAGASVIDTSGAGGGVPDLIIGINGVTILMEIKNPKTSYGRKGLNKNQERWVLKWQGGVFCMVDSVEAALRAIHVFEPKKAEALAAIGVTA